MNKVTSPLKPPMQGPAVADLQNALQALLDRRAVLANDESGRQQLSAALQRERVGQTYGTATRKLVAVIQQEKQLVVGAGNEGNVDEQTAATINAMLRELGVLVEDAPTGEPVYKVSGTVRFADGFPAAGFSVSAFDRDLRNEQPLRPSEISEPPRTDKEGRYEIQYFARQFSNREKLTADIVVKIFAADGTRLAASPVLFNAPPVAQVDVAIPAEALKSPTLFERIAGELAPLLEGVTLAELEEDQEHQDVTFLAGETGLAKADLARFIMAHRLVELGIQAEFWFVLLGGTSFAIAENQSLRQRISAIVDLLPTLDASAVNKSLVAGFNRREIPEALQSQVAAWIEAFLQIASRSPQSKSPTASFVRAALEEAGVKDAVKQGAFVRLFNEHRALTPDLLKALEADRSFSQEEIAELRSSFELADLTRGDFSVVGMLKRAADIHQPEQIRSLAKKSVTEWVDLVRTTRASGEINIPLNLSDDADAAARVPKLDATEVYGQMIERQFREAFPTAAFSGGLARALQSGEIRGLRQPEALSRFLEGHDRFELLNTPIDDFLDHRIQPQFASMASDQGLRLELKAVQRVFKVAPNFSATSELLADDLHSAQQIYRVGQSEFVRSYASRPGFTEESARVAWNRAANTHAAVLTVVADLKSLDAEALPQALKSGPAPLSSFPNWNNLFQSGDLCDCEQCRSVLSPAAYFADLLMFLKDRKSAKPPQTVKDILFNRRRDLGYLELNCENALTPIPYIDTVCEVMEDVVAAGGNDLELAGFAAMPADPVIARKTVANAFAAEAIDLGGDFTVRQVSSADPNRWVVHGEAVTYLLKKKATPDFFAEILRNTKASAAELRAYPQYVNPKAYETLRAAKYPLSLPFDLFAAEVRAAFQKSNLQRWDLMRALRGATAPNNPTDGEIAAEYFGISVDAGAPFDERRLLLVADPTAAGQKLIWGESAATWLSIVGNVKNFLRKTSLEYNELLTLLDLKFINPTGALGIHHLDASCDTDKKIIQVLNAGRLDAIHRFLRLWRKLESWQMWELDLVVGHPAIGNGAIDEAFLINLFYFSRLKSRLGNKVTVEQVCGLFGNLNTVTAFIGLYEKRADAHYQSLFLNKRLVHPLDPAFQLDPATHDLPAGETLTAHHPALLAALGIRDADLNVLKGLTKASDGTPYIDDGLTLANLSFLWRHAWLSRSLQLKSDEWPTTLKLFQQDVDSFPGPQAAWQFVAQVDLLKASGFTADELNWLLAADRASKATIKETDAARFLTALRKDLQAIRAEFDPAQYEFLTAAPPSDTDRLAALLTTLLQKLNRDEASAQQFVAALRDEIVQEEAIATLPAGFNFPAAISGAPNNIAIRYEPLLHFTGAMTAGQRTVLLTDAALATVTGRPGYQQAIADLFLKPGSARVNDLPAGFAFPATITGAPHNIPIRYEPVLRLTGVLTTAQKTTLLTSPTLAAITGIAAYQQTIGEFFATPRLAFKFFEPIFTAPLRNLPAAVDFKLLVDPALALKISYDAELRLLRFNGVLSSDEKAALDGLSANVDYRNAVNSIASQPATIAPPDERIWLLDADLKFPLRDLDTPANDHLASNLAVAVARALGYLSKRSSEQTVVTQASTQLELTEAVTRRLLTSYAVLPDTLLKHFTEALPATSGVVDYATLQATFDAWFWATRLGGLLKKWNLLLDEWERLDELAAAAQLLDVQKLPLNSLAAIASMEHFLRTSRLLRLHASLPESGITLLEVLQKLNAGTYATAADFAIDMQGVNDAWLAADVEAFVNAVDAAYPADYLLAETLERMRSALDFVDQLNTGIGTVKTFAAAAMTAKHSSTLQGLIRSKLGTETSLELITEIQDVLRERKRDALSAHLLAQAMPVDAPSGKWDNTNDLYAYYLLDVEMCSCQLTSRLVQGSGSVQLFVQRCLMGLEPAVRVEIDGDRGDSAWRWWQWMSKYRVWEANRKVFLWPENWIEPELKKDRSPFFRDLENELMQNEVNPFTVETAYSNYL
ncbi:MAG: hypothetical protein JWL65_584, partial [Gammaproteobacteria bacterium]|nr:hypothetical protein [Gammaproteobacteria bacterium]